MKPSIYERAHQWVIIDGKLTDSHLLAAADMVYVRGAEGRGAVLCPTCKGPMRIVMGDPVSWAEHTVDARYADHEPEDPELRKAKRMVMARLKQLFPNLDPHAIGLDSPLDEIDHLADVALATNMGGRLAVEVQLAEMDAEDVAGLCANYEKIGVVALWLLDSRRLVMQKPKRGVNKQIRRTTLGPLETGLIAQNIQLLYLNANRQEVTWIRPPRDAVELARLGDKKLGRIDCLVRTYRLSQMRIENGHWWFETVYELNPPAPPPLPAAAQKRLDKKREAAGIIAPLPGQHKLL